MLQRLALQLDRKWRLIIEAFAPSVENFVEIICSSLDEFYSMYRPSARGFFATNTEGNYDGSVHLSGNRPVSFFALSFLIFFLFSVDDCRLGLKFHSGGYLKDNIETLPELIRFMGIYKIILPFLGSAGDVGALANLDLARSVGTLA